MNIITEFIKIINSRIGEGLLIALLVANSVFLGLFLGLNAQIHKDSNVVAVFQSEESQNKDKEAHTAEKVIFGSSKGKYFYYKGCGGTSISAKNLVYYTSEAQAIAQGKVLYKSCE